MSIEAGVETDVEVKLSRLAVAFALASRCAALLCCTAVLRQAVDSAVGSERAVSGQQSFFFFPFPFAGRLVL